jgi:hypothetical protein
MGDVRVGLYVSDIVDVIYYPEDNLDIKKHPCYNVRYSGYKAL